MDRTPSIGMRRAYAARFAESTGASGTGPQMYAEKTGVGSVLSPLDMTIPIGSDESCSVSLRSFFIALSLYGCYNAHCGPSLSTRYATFDAECKPLLINSLR